MGYHDESRNDTKLLYRHCDWVISSHTKEHNVSHVMRETAFYDTTQYII